MPTLAGVIAENLPWVDPEKPANVDKWGSTAFWMADVPYVASTEYIYGVTSGDPPIEFVSWSISGRIGETGLEWWRRGLSLLLRHI